MEGKVFVITGSSGIAASTARKLVGSGAHVYVVGIDHESVASLFAELCSSDRIAYQLGDVTEAGTGEQVVAGCKERFGRIDGLFNVVGISGRKYGDGPLHESTFEGWQKTMRTNLDSQYAMSQAVIRELLQNERNSFGQRGVLLNMSSILGIHPEPTYFSALAYATSKGAIASLTRTMAAYYAAEGIRVNAIAPALTETAMSGRAAADADIQEFVRKKQALTGGMMQPDDIADVALFLLSDAARVMTGQTILADGGWSVL